MTVDSESPAIVGPLVMAGARVALRPPGPEDYPLLRSAELEGSLATLWRYRGTTPSPDLQFQRLWEGVLSQYLVISVTDQKPIGLWACYNSDFRNGYAYIAAVKFDTEDRSTLFLEGGVLFIDCIFRASPFRKLYVESNELTLGQYSSAVGEVMEVEGRLTDRVYFDGHYLDEIILSIGRTRWNGWAEHARRFVMA